jgi:hypothetical protein
MREVLNDSINNICKELIINNIHMHISPSLRQQGGGLRGWVRVAPKQD